MDNIEYEIELLNPFKHKLRSKKTIEEFNKEKEEEIAFKGDNSINEKDVDVIDRDVKKTSNYRVWSKKVKKIFKNYPVKDMEFVKRSKLFEMDNKLKLKLKPETLSELIDISAIADNFGWQAIHLWYYIDPKKLENFVKNNLERCLSEDSSFE